MPASPLWHVRQKASPERTHQGAMGPHFSSISPENREFKNLLPLFVFSKLKNHKGLGIVVRTMSK